MSPEPESPDTKQAPPHKVGALLRHMASWVPIRSLSSRHRRKVGQHLMELGERDRYLRFGYPATDEQIGRYVAGLDFERDELLGIFSRSLALVAMAHLAYEPMPQLPGKPAMVEFGVSVAKRVRGRGFGARLFESAALHARNRGVETLFIHALSENVPMLKIARKAGARVERDGSESEAWLRLPQDTVSSHVGEAIERHMAEMDFQFKRHVRTVGNIIDSVAEVKSRLDGTGKPAKPPAPAATAPNTET